MESLTDPAWFIAAGLVLVSMALVGSVIRRLPLSTSTVYLMVGVVLGPLGFGLLLVDPVAHAPIIELVTEVAVLISLFTAGLKLRLPLRDRAWLLPIRLASVAMVLTVVMVAVIGMMGLGLSLGAAVLLGAILAPTDPVLASDVQVSGAFDRDHVRFTLTGEAGLNDGTAFPFVMLGLGLLGLHELGPMAFRWLAVDLLWAVAAGLGVGTLLGTLVGRAVAHLRSRFAAAVGMDEFLLLGLIALAYGTALVIGAYGFLAVCAAGRAVRRLEREATGDEPPVELRQPVAGVDDEAELTAEAAPAYFAHSLLTFNEALERVAEVGLVILVAAALSAVGIASAGLLLVPLMFLLVRPVAVLGGLAGADLPRPHRALCAWFGIRGIGSLYYLAYATNHGLDPALASLMTEVTLTVVAASILVHGVSVTPLMDLYERRRRGQGRVAPDIAGTG
ncbi:MAG: cation:proton antiporter [Chloroflexi bacterium]|nr:cation:proton antiporter [Chloroflexota bacterium]